MLNSMVLVCEGCGNVELKVTPVKDGGERVLVFYCPQCGNLGRIRGFTAGPVALRAERVREIKDRAARL